jgi:hypothetical protein
LLEIELEVKIENLSLNVDYFSEVYIRPCFEYRNVTKFFWLKARKLCFEKEHEMQKETVLV